MCVCAKSRFLQSLLFLCIDFPRPILFAFCSACVFGVSSLIALHHPCFYFSLLASRLLSRRLARHAWRDSARHSQLSPTRPAGYPSRQPKIWRACQTLIFPSASTGWTGSARACRWPARPARPSCGRQVSPLSLSKIEKFHISHI